ncbi:type II toxin-antitoxin system VapC family toxin [Desulfococcaceae bacterium HSG8]|nr:type II toxin-antitoxin system VapC family toxin [Desulfococcaceae bacterium HSG8]
MKFLCDTNIISEVMRRAPNPRVQEWLRQQDIICMSVISVEEIYVGLAHKKAKKQLRWFEKFVRLRCNILPVTLPVAVRCGTLRGRFRSMGITRTQADMLIAATAYEHGLVPVSRNVRDFENCDIRIFNPFDD